MSGAGSAPTVRLDPEVRRAQILDAAEGAFAGRDPAEVTFEQIAAEAGVSRALVYNYFGDKGGLIAAAQVRAFERLDHQLDDAVDPEATAAERSRQLVCAYLRFAERNAGLWGLVGRSGATRHPAVQHARQARFERTASAWGGTAEAHAVVCGVVGAIEAVTLHWLDHQDDLPLDRVAEVLHRLVWEGVGSLDGSVVTVPAAGAVALPT